MYLGIPVEFPKKYIQNVFAENRLWMKGIELFVCIKATIRNVDEKTFMRLYWIFVEHVKCSELLFYDDDLGIENNVEVKIFH